VIVSVPHTGTRTLVEVLHEPVILGRPQRILNGQKHFHFDQHESLYFDRKEHIHFPLRDPLATSLSWRAQGVNRLHGRRGNVEVYDEFRCTDVAIDYLMNYEHGWTGHIMEELPVLKGQSKPTWYKEAYKARDLEALMELPETIELLKWYPSAKHFFEPFYGKFWWEAPKTP